MQRFDDAVVCWGYKVLLKHKQLLNIQPLLVQHNLSLTGEEVQGRETEAMAFFLSVFKWCGLLSKSRHRASCQQHDQMVRAGQTFFPPSKIAKSSACLALSPCPPGHVLAVWRIWVTAVASCYPHGGRRRSLTQCSFILSWGCFIQWSQISSFSLYFYGGARCFGQSFHVPIHWFECGGLLDNESSRQVSSQYTAILCNAFSNLGLVE